MEGERRNSKEKEKGRTSRIASIRRQRGRGSVVEVEETKQDNEKWKNGVEQTQGGTRGEKGEKKKAKITKRMRSKTEEKTKRQKKNQNNHNQTKRKSSSK